MYVTRFIVKTLHYELLILITDDSLKFLAQDHARIRDYLVVTLSIRKFATCIGNAFLGFQEYLVPRNLHLIAWRLICNSIVVSCWYHGD